MGLKIILTLPHYSTKFILTWFKRISQNIIGKIYRVIWTEKMFFMVNLHLYPNILQDFKMTFLFKLRTPKQSMYLYYFVRFFLKILLSNILYIFVGNKSERQPIILRLYTHNSADPWPEGSRGVFFITIGPCNGQFYLFIEILIDLSFSNMINKLN